MEMEIDQSSSSSSSNRSQKRTAAEMVFSSPSHSTASNTPSATPQMESITTTVYDPLSSSALLPASSSSIPISTSSTQSGAPTFIHALLPTTATASYQSKLQGRTMILQNLPPALDPSKQANQKRKLTRRRKGELTYGEKKELGLTALALKSVPYEDILPLHKLWCEYITDLLNDSSIREKGDAKIMRADWHGAHLHIIKTTCPTKIGLHGICIQETAEVFRIACEDNHVRTIAKRRTIFHIEINNRRFEIFGDHCAIRSAERSVRKFKNKPTIALRSS